MWDAFVACLHQLPNGDAKCLATLANVAQILSLFSIIAAIVGIWIAWKNFLSDRDAERQRRDQQRRTMWLALRLEVENADSIATHDETHFNVNAGPYIWTLLPMATMEESLRGAALLNLSSEDIGALQDLRNKITRANMSIAQYFSLIHASGSYGQQNIDQINNLVNAEVGRVRDSIRVVADRFRGRWR